MSTVPTFTFVVWSFNALSHSIQNNCFFFDLIIHLLFIGFVYPLHFFLTQWLGTHQMFSFSPTLCCLPLFSFVVESTINFFFSPRLMFPSTKHLFFFFPFFNTCWILFRVGSTIGIHFGVNPLRVFIVVSWFFSSLLNSVPCWLHHRSSFWCQTTERVCVTCWLHEEKTTIVHPLSVCFCVKELLLASSVYTEATTTYLKNIIRLIIFTLIPQLISNQPN